MPGIAYLDRVKIHQLKPKVKYYGIACKMFIVAKKSTCIFKTVLAVRMWNLCSGSDLKITHYLIGIGKNGVIVSLGKNMNWAYCSISMKLSCNTCGNCSKACPRKAIAFASASALIITA